MNESIIAHRYALALYNYATEKSIDQVIYQDIHLVREQLAKSKQGMKFMNSPNIKVSGKKLFLKDVFGNHIHSGTLNFLYLVIDQQRQSLLDDILRIYEDIYKQKHQIFSVDITTATKLNDGQILLLKQMIAQKLDGEVDLSVNTNPALIGGSVLRINDKLLDTSIRSQLKRIEKQLSE